MEDLYLDANRHAQDLRETWQARALAESNGRMAAVVFIVLMFNYKAAMQVLLRVVFPKAPLAKNGWPEINKPYLCGKATIQKNGWITCPMITRLGGQDDKSILYLSPEELNRDLHRLAAKIKATDQEMIEMAQAVKNWIVRDLRIDHLGRRLAS